MTPHVGHLQSKWLPSGRRSSPDGRGGDTTNEVRQDRQAVVNSQNMLLFSHRGLVPSSTLTYTFRVPISTHKTISHRGTWPATRPTGETVGTAETFRREGAILPSARDRWETSPSAGSQYLWDFRGSCLGGGSPRERRETHTVETFITCDTRSNGMNETEREILIGVLTLREGLKSREWTPTGTPHHSLGAWRVPIADAEKGRVSTQGAPWSSGLPAAGRQRVSRAYRALEQAGLIVRHGDGRTSCLALTSEGDALARKLAGQEEHIGAVEAGPDA